MILFLNGNEKRKNRRKLPLLIQFYSRGQNGDFCNSFCKLQLQKKRIKVRWKTQIVEFFELFLCGVILFLNGNEKRKNRRKLPLLIQFYSRRQNSEFTRVDKMENLFGKLHSIQKKN